MNKHTIKIVVAVILIGAISGAASALVTHIMGDKIKLALRA